MKILTIGPCPVCERQIYVPDPADNKKFLKASYYAEFFMLLSDGTKRKYAICKDCLVTMTDEYARDILSNDVFTQVMQAFSMGRESKIFDILRTTELIGWFLTEEKLADFYKENYD